MDKLYEIQEKEILHIFMCMLKLHDQSAPIITASNEMTHKVLY